MPADPDAGAVDAASAAVGKDALDHHVERRFPAVDLIVAEEDLGKTRSVRLHARIAAVAVDGLLTAEDQASAASFEHRRPDISSRAWINRNRFPWNACLKERFR